MEGLADDCVVTLVCLHSVNGGRVKTVRDELHLVQEASLVERLERVDVIVVQGSDRNIKITKPTDLELAELFLAEERAEGEA